MKSWKQPTEELVFKALKLAKKETDRRYFFSRLKNPLWLPILLKEGYYNQPPKIQKMEDGSERHPFWPEFDYLANIVHEIPEDVVAVIKKFRPTDNPRILDSITDIACSIEDIDLSVSLVDYLLLLVEGKHDHYAYDPVIKLMQRWSKGPEKARKTAIFIMKQVVFFQADPKAETKLRKQREDPNSFGNNIEPKPIFGGWEYQEIMQKGVRALAEQEPKVTSQVLIKALERLITLKYPDNTEESGNDHSEAWCGRLDNSESLHKDAEKELIHTLTYTCEEIYERHPDLIPSLDDCLRKTNWLIFKRIRQHLYAKFSDKAQKEWIQQLIREPERDYGERSHHYDFQRMLHAACDTYGITIFEKGELECYMEAIIAGPDKKKYIERCKRGNGSEPTEEDFVQRQAFFHRNQLRPFASVLFDQYKKRFDELIAQADDTITDDDYYPTLMRGGTVHSRSPVNSTDLENMSDDELFTYLQNWDSVKRIYSSKDEPVEVTYGALSISLKNHFAKTISGDRDRTLWWLKQAKAFTRPLYCGAIVDALAELIESGEHSYLSESFDFCNWVLSNGDPVPQHNWDEDREDADPEKKSWSNCRTAVLGFIAKCLTEKAGLTQDWRQQIFSVYEKLCTGPDIMLEKKQDRAETANAHSLVSTAINRTRSRALENLFGYANWVRKAAGSNCEIQEVIEVIDRRLSGNPPLTNVERVLLTMHFGNLRWLDEKWAKTLVPKLFAHDDLWQQCFSAYLTHSNHYQADFKYLEPEYFYAFSSVAPEGEIDKDGDDKDSWIINKWMGYHLLIFYLSGKIDLYSENSLCLELLYKATEQYRELWGDLFNRMGRNLGDWGAGVDEKIIQRVKDFFIWRVEQKEPKELSKYLFWLDGACLEPEWRMEGFLRTLPFADDDDVKASMITDKLHEHFLESHPDMVLQCFAEVTKAAERKHYFYVSKESAIPILKVGLASQNKATKAYAEEARENLLKAGRFEYLHLEED
jgi:hypothetical protein